MILTFENYLYNESVEIPKDKIEKALKIIQKKFPYEKLIKYIKKYKSEIRYILQKYTNGKDTVFYNKIMVTNEGFKDTIFYEVFIEPFTEEWLDNRFWGAVVGSLIWITTIGSAFLLYLLGVLLYLNFFYTPIQKGVVKDKEFTPAHTAMTPMIISNGKSTTTILVPTYIPDTWNVEVKEIDSEESEIWTTRDKNTAENITLGRTITWDDESFDVLKGK